VLGGEKMTVKEFLYSKGIKRNGIYSTEFSTYYHTLLGLINISKLKNKSNEYSPEDLEKLFKILEKTNDLYKEE
jgi:hypothetical protein